ncbi:hypothetical protein KCU90_g2966, partial [Aureobasidium melanogenum]
LLSATQLQSRESPKREHGGLPHEIIGGIFHDHAGYKRHARGTQPRIDSPQPIETHDEAQQQRGLQHNSDDPRLQPRVDEQVVRVRQRIRFEGQQAGRHFAAIDQARQRLAEAHPDPCVTLSLADIKRPQLRTRVCRYRIADCGQRAWHIDLMTLDRDITRQRDGGHRAGRPQTGTELERADARREHHGNDQHRQQQTAPVQREQRDQKRNGRGRPEEPVKRRQSDEQAQRDAASTDHAPTRPQHEARK